MNIKETKTMVNAILDLNESDDKFTYTPGMFFHDGGIIVSCMVHNKKSGEGKYVQNFRGDILHRIEDVRNILIVSEAKYIESKKFELTEALKKLEGM